MQIGSYAIIQPLIHKASDRSVRPYEWTVQKHEYCNHINRSAQYDYFTGDSSTNLNIKVNRIVLEVIRGRKTQAYHIVQ